MRHGPAAEPESGYRSEGIFDIFVKGELATTSSSVDPMEDLKLQVSAAEVCGFNTQLSNTECFRYHQIRKAIGGGEAHRLQRHIVDMDIFKNGRKNKHRFDDLVQYLP